MSLRRHERSLLTLPMSAGMHCDVTIGNTDAVINSTVLSYLANIDSRFSPLVRLVKHWARAEGINDSSRGTFSSYALTLMVGMWTSLTCSMQPHMLLSIALFSLAPRLTCRKAQLCSMLPCWVETVKVLCSILSL